MSLPATDASGVRSSVALSEERNESFSSAVSWAAIIAGALTTSALGLILLALGAGFELSSISPFSARPGTLRTLGSATIAWMVFSQIVGGALGGYLAGRLRTKWTRLHTDEVYFRDTAHGFLAWALATIGSAAFLASAGSTLATGTRVIAAESLTPPVVYSDQLSLRSDNPSIAAATNERAAEVAQAVDAQRRLAARLLLWTFVSLLCGALAASFSATIGGRQRDRIPAV